MGGQGEEMPTPALLGCQCPHFTLGPNAKTEINSERGSDLAKVTWQMEWQGLLAVPGYGRCRVGPLLVGWISNHQSQGPGVGRERHTESYHPSHKGPYSQLACLWEWGTHYPSSGSAFPGPGHRNPGSLAHSGPAPGQEATGPALQQDDLAA